MIAVFTLRDDVNNCIQKWKISGVQSWKDEIYPPGGHLRILKDSSNRTIAGPLVSEIISFELLPE